MLGPRGVAVVVATAASYTAGAAPLDVDPQVPPTVVVEATQHAPAWLRFPDGTQVQTLPAVIVTTEPGAGAPSPDARPLGASERSWRVPARDAQQAIDRAAALRQRPGVTSALPDLVLPHHSTAFDDPRYTGQWYLDLLEVDALYDVTLGDPDVRVAVVDSAINTDHEDLVGAWVAPRDVWSGDDDTRPDPGVYCGGGDTTSLCDDHGTAVSGIIGARANNGVGIVGLCPECTLVPIRMLGEGGGSLGRDVAAFEHAIEQDAAVINNSWGFTTSIPVPLPLAEVIRRAATETRGGLGSVIVFAAGNDDRVINDNELQAMPEVLCVSATDRYGLPTAYTNEGASVDVAAPSATVTLSGDGGYLTTFGGTSAAAPVVSGLAAWALSVDPTLSATEVRELLIDTAVPSPQVTPDENGHHPVYGYGEISALALKEALVPEVPDEEPTGGCGCDASPTGVLGWALLVPLLGLRRRR